MDARTATRILTGKAGPAEELLVALLVAVGLDEVVDAAVDDEVDEAVADVVEDDVVVLAALCWPGSTNASVVFSQLFSLAWNMASGSWSLPPENTTSPFPSSAAE